MTDTQLNDEAGRLKALQRYGVFDSGPEADFDRITGIVAALLGVPICAVTLIDEDTQLFKSIRGLESIGTARRDAFCDHTIRGRGPLVIEDATADGRFSANPLVTGEPRIRSYAGHPLTTPDGYNLGALCAIGHEPRQFTDSELALLEKFAGLVVDLLELRTLAHRDFLTGALSRRAFIDGAAASLRQLDRDAVGGWLLLVDIDHFKAVNDRFGHPVGDAVLKAMAGCVRGLLRPTDLFGRLGGEEFGLLLPGVGATSALACAERLRNAVAAMVIDGLPTVTVSIGLAPLTASASLDQVMADADAALYAAKHGGRNCCRLADVAIAA